MAEEENSVNNSRKDKKRKRAQFVSLKFSESDNAEEEKKHEGKWPFGTKLVLNSHHVPNVVKGSQGILTKCVKLQNGECLYDVQFFAPTSQKVEKIPEGWLQPKGLITSSTDVDRLSLREVLQKTKRFDVPMFQRKYCWAEHQWDLLWENACGEYHGQLEHCMGRLMLWAPSTSDSSLLLVVDGQQRLTTCCILLASLRDFALKHDAKALVKTIHDNLFIHPKAEGLTGFLHERGSDINLDDFMLDNNCDTFLLFQSLIASSPLREGEVLQCSRFVPSYFDRAPFFEAIMNTKTPNGNFSHSHILQAKKRFHELIAKKLDGEPDPLLILQFILQSVLDKLCFVHFQIEGDYAIHDVFERLIHKDMLTKVYNPLHQRNVGIRMSPIDLIRNHVLEFFYGEKAQLDVYNSYWKPLEAEDIDKVEQFFIDQLKLRASKSHKDEVKFSNLYKVFKEHLKQQSGSDPVKIRNELQMLVDAAMKMKEVDHSTTLTFGAAILFAFALHKYINV